MVVKTTVRIQFFNLNAAPTRILKTPNKDNNEYRNINLRKFTHSYQKLRCCIIISSLLSNDWIKITK